MNKKVFDMVGAVNDMDLNSSDAVYGLWTNMINRCYNPANLKKNPSYINTEVCKNWLLVSNFHDFYIHNYHEGFQLDKDLLKIGNDIYCPEYCVFVPQFVNLSIVFNKKSGGLLGTQKKGNRYIAHISYNHKQYHLGSFITEMEAHKAWQQSKMSNFQEVALRYKFECTYNFNSRVYDAIIERKNLISNDLKNNRVTYKY